MDRGGRAPLTDTLVSGKRNVINESAPHPSGHPKKKERAGSLTKRSRKLKGPPKFFLETGISDGATALNSP
jgi:hypothetical protein